MFRVSELTFAAFQAVASPGGGDEVAHQASEVEFCRHLGRALLISRRDPSEIPGAYVGQVCVGLEKVRMVERVKHLKSELQAFSLREIPVFLNGHVPIEEPGPVKVGKKPGSVSERE